jgi:hypothetical protein
MAKYITVRFTKKKKYHFFRLFNAGQFALQTKVF